MKIRQLFLTLLYFTRYTVYSVEQAELDGHIYQFVDKRSERLSWEDANNLATSLELCGVPGHLATISSTREQDIVHTFVEESTAYTSLYAAWIGFSDIANEGVYTWIDNATVTFTNWKVGEPSGVHPEGSHNLTEDCVVMLKADGMWNDFPCVRKMPYIVEFDCPRRYTFLSHQYQLFSNVPLDWSNASEAANKLQSCDGVQGHLASVDSEEEQTFLWELFKQEGRTGRKTYGPWIGLNDLGGAFVWDDGSSSNYTNWVMGEPSQTVGVGNESISEDCVNMWAINGGRWNDLPCESEQPYFVEYACNPSSSSVTEIVHDGHTYQMFHAELNWFDAQATAASIPSPCDDSYGHLVSVDSVAENNAVYELFLRELGGALGPWLGLSSTTDGEEYTWSSGELIGNFNNWDLDPGNDNCVRMSPISRLWETAPCFESRSFIVEFDCAAQGGSFVQGGAVYALAALAVIPFGIIALLVIRKRRSRESKSELSSLADTPAEIIPYAQVIASIQQSAGPEYKDQTRMVCVGQRQP